MTSKITAIIVSSSSGQKIHHQRAQRAHAQEQPRLVYKEARGMIGGRAGHVLILRRGADEVEEPGHLLLKVGEILRHHHALLLGELALASDALERRYHSVGERLVVV